MSKLTLFALAATALLAACSDPHTQPGVSAYSRQGVSLVEPQGVKLPEQMLVSRAAYFCQLSGMASATKISSRALPRPHGTEHNYQCSNGS